MTAIHREQGVTVVELDANYNAFDEERLRSVDALLAEQAHAADPARLVLDMSGTEYIGSRFLEAMFHAWKRIRERDGRMAVCGVSPFCADVLRTTRLDTLWESFPTRGEAVEALAGSSASWE